MSRIVFEDVYSITNFEREDELTIKQLEQLQRIETRLLAQEPLQYVMGMADFYGLKFRVDSRVLIPRQETEELVYWVLETAKTAVYRHVSKVLDIGTGSGCIPITLKKENPNLHVEAIDVSVEALDLAMENARLNDVSIAFREQDILDESNWNTAIRYDIIVSNPPYIPREEATLMPQNVKAFEPHIALFVENEDPLLFYRTIAKFALQTLQKQGLLFFETNEFNASAVQQMLEEMNFSVVELQKDMSGKERMIRAQF